MRAVVSGCLVAAIIATACIPQVTIKPQPPPYTTESFAIRARQFNTITLKWLQRGNTLEGYFVTQGGGNDVDFRVVDPQGRALTDLRRVAGRYDFRLDVVAEGPYSLVFGNGFSWFTGKQVTLVYRAY